MQAKEQDSNAVIHEEKCSNNSVNVSASAVGMHNAHLKENEMPGRVS